MCCAGVRLLRIRSIRQVFHNHIRTIGESKALYPPSISPCGSHSSFLQGNRTFVSGRILASCTMAVDTHARPSPDEFQKKKKQKVVPPSVQYRIRIQQAAKKDTVDDAFAAFEESKAEDVRLPPDCLVTLLFLAAGGDRWEDLVYCEEKRDEHLKTKRLEKCDEILGCIEASGSPVVEMCYTALARRDAIYRQGSNALEQARKVVQDSRMAQKLRCFLPALAAFGASGDAHGALDAYHDIMDAGLEPGEVEFSKLVQSFSKHYDGEGKEHLPWTRIESILKHMSRETTELDTETITNLRRLFTSQQVSKYWTIDDCNIEGNGYCAFCHETLQAIDLDTDEYSQFAAGIAALATKQEKRPHEFDSFVQWLDKHGPFGIIIDAANVAFYGQNFETGGFSFPQIESVVSRVKKDFAHLKPLVILHVNRTRGGPANTYKAKSLLKDLTEEHCFYAAPQGSNDDWYWMYAAVSAGQEGILISNDEMRDHLFNLLAPKYFKKWKQRHQMRYTFSGEPDSLQFQNPPPYTRCTQQLGTSWMFPMANQDTWLCAKKRVD